MQCCKQIRFVQKVCQTEILRKNITHTKTTESVHTEIKPLLGLLYGGEIVVIHQYFMLV